MDDRPLHGRIQRSRGGSRSDFIPEIDAFNAAPEFGHFSFVISSGWKGTRYGHDGQENGIICITLVTQVTRLLTMGGGASTVHKSASSMINLK